MVAPSLYFTLHIIYVISTVSFDIITLGIGLCSITAILFANSEIVISLDIAVFILYLNN